MAKKDMRCAMEEENPVKGDWYEEHKSYVKEYSERLEKVLPEMFEK